MSADRVENLRAWQLTYKFKLAVYELRNERVASDFRLRDQLRESAASAVSQMEEGFARFYPKDHANSSLAERLPSWSAAGTCDAVDRGHITPETRRDLDSLAREALHEIGGLLDYLQSPEAERNARRIKERRAERRQRRKNRNDEPGTANPEPRTERPNKNREPGTGNEEPV